ncbi:MAG: ribose-phosphate diphosphokinase [Bacilli bacterium]|nr:ribose-phosphate diphosphokinase [Bacilli bacterium]
MNDLKLIVLDNIREVGKEVDEYLQKMNRAESSYIMKLTNDRFSNGEGKIRIDETIRDKDVFIMADIGNYGETYSMHGFEVHMGPDEHFQDIKRAISALSGYARRIIVIMPLLYQSRQDKRKGRESLDCALALQELERLKVNHIITFDCHQREVSNAIPNLPFENIYPTNTILEDLVDDISIKNILVISPDMGAMERARYYADMLQCDVGVFYKRRDLSKVVNGKNPIVEHAYMGADVTNKTCIVVDDMIASGGSMIEVGEKLKEKGAKKVIFIASFALFTEGIEKFEEAYKNKVFNMLYTTNLTYIPKEFKKKKWLHTVDCSKRIAELINAIHKGKSTSKIIHGSDKIFKIINESK